MVLAAAFTNKNSAPLQRVSGSEAASPSDLERRYSLHAAQPDGRAPGARAAASATRSHHAIGAGAVPSAGRNRRNRRPPSPRDKDRELTRKQMREKESDVGSAFVDAGWQWQRPHCSAHRPGPTQKLKRKRAVCGVELQHRCGFAADPRADRARTPVPDPHDTVDGQKLEISFKACQFRRARK
jgi:hypothetical protein